jgi:rubrerythrin
MAAFDRTANVLEYCRNMHRRLIACYEQSLARATDERDRRILNYLIDQEVKLSETLAESVKSLPGGVSGRWFQFVPETELADIIDAECGKDSSVDDVLRLALRCRNELVSLYTRMAEIATGSEATHDFFADLAETVEKERDLLAISVQRYQSAQ